MSQKAGLLIFVLAASMTVSGCVQNDKNLESRVVKLEEQVQALQTGMMAVGAKPDSQETAEMTMDAAPEVKVTAHYTDLAQLPDPELKSRIEQLGTLGVFDEKSGVFKPFEPITRAEYVVWVYKAYNAMHPDSQIRLAPQAKPLFSDLPASHPAYKYAQALANAGYSVGYEDGTFRPENVITRDEMLGIKVPVDLGGEAPDFMWGNFGPSFSDNGSLRTNRFAKHIQADFGYRKGYYLGGSYGNNVERAFGNIKTFKPKEPVLRFEAAATVWQTDTKGEKTALSALGGKGEPTQ